MDKKKGSKIRAHEGLEYVLEHPSTVVERRKSGTGMPIVAIAVGILALGAVVLLVHLSPWVDTSTNRASANMESGPGLLGSIQVKDGNGFLLSSAGVSESGTITFSDYYSEGYTLDLTCTIDSLPLYCDGTPITIADLPPGTHTLVIMEVGSQASPLTFSWIIE